MRVTLPWAFLPTITTAADPKGHADRVKKFLGRGATLSIVECKESSIGHLPVLTAVVLAPSGATSSLRFGNLTRRKTIGLALAGGDITIVPGVHLADSGRPH